MSAEKIYRGYRKMELDLEGKPMTSKCIVTVESKGRKRLLSPRLDIRRHSPTGFEWGYGGSGPAQLALALVADCCGATSAVPHIYQKVKAVIVSRLPHDGWKLTEDEIRVVVQNAIIDREEL
jgi:hypothetical protein